MIQGVGLPNTLRRRCSVCQYGCPGSLIIHSKNGVLLRISWDMAAQNDAVRNARATASKSASIGTSKHLLIGQRQQLATNSAVGHPSSPELHCLNAALLRRNHR